MLDEELLSLDRDLIWHPYSQHGLGQAPIPVRRAQGAYLELSDGRKVIDGISSWWVNVHGHGHPLIQAAISKQAQDLDHVLFAGFTHEPAVALARALLHLARGSGADLSRVFFSDNGSTAVEVALKMAFQFHQNRGDRARTRFIALRGSYHGDTLGAMSVNEPEGYHRVFRPLLPLVDFVKAGDLESLERLLSGPSCSHAAFIFEPLIQGAAGMRTYSPDFLRNALALCRSRGVLGIADEVFTGFYRTGHLFAFGRAGISPDFLCLSKGLTGGVLPMAVTLAREEIFEAFRGSEIRQAFLHGHSFTANPIGCAAALASLRIFETPGYLDHIARLEEITRLALQKLSSLPGVKETRTIGTIGAVEVSREFDYFSRSPARMTREAIERGVLLRPLGNVLYAVPPYCITETELNHVYHTLEELVHASNRDL